MLHRILEIEASILCYCLKIFAITKIGILLVEHRNAMKADTYQLPSVARDGKFCRYSGRCQLPFLIVNYKLMCQQAIIITAIKSSI